MTADVQHWLDAFEALSDSDKRIAVAEILRRLPEPEDADLTDDELVATADELFRRLDEEESANETH